MITLNEEQFNGLISHLGEQPAKFATPLINFFEQLKAEQNKEGQEMNSGNIPLTVEEVEAWSDSMDYIENLVLDRLNLTKKQ